MLTVLGELGLHEVPGPKASNPKIMEFLELAQFRAGTGDDSGTKNAQRF